MKLLISITIFALSVIFKTRLEKNVAHGNRLYQVLLHTNVNSKNSKDSRSTWQLTSLNFTLSGTRREQLVLPVIKCYLNTTVNGGTH
jgi:hypothetical protein